MTDGVGAATVNSPAPAAVAPAGSGRAARLALLVLVPIAVFNQLDRTILSILQVPIKRELGLSDTQLGALTGLAFAVVYCILTIPMSRIADRVVRKYLMAGCLVLWCAMTALSGLASSFLMLAVLRMGVALGESACSPTTVSMLADYFPREKRGMPMAVWAMSVPIGTMIGLVGGGWLSGTIGWRNVFICVGLAGLVMAPLLLMLKEPPRGQFDAAPAAGERPPSIAQAVAILWRLRAMRWLMVAGAFQAFVVCSMQFWAAPLYARAFGMSLAHTGLALAFLFGAGGGLGALVGGYLVDRLTRRDVRWYGWLPALAALGMIPFALGQFLVTPPVLSLGLGFCAFVFLNCYLSPVNAATQSLVLPAMRAFTSAVLLVFSNLIGLGLGPLFTGAMSDLFIRRGFGDQSVRYALSAAVLVGFAAAFAFYRSARPMARELV